MPPVGRVRYRNIVADNARWDAFRLRPGDIIISTPAKCGTTWTQMLVALVVFDTDRFDAPLDQLSPWLDQCLAPLEDVVALLDAQEHRRFIKTHTPLDGLPYQDDVTYLGVGRDPRDVSLSWDHHFANMDADAFFAARAEAVGVDDLGEFEPPTPMPDDPVERFRAWMEAPDEIGIGVVLASVLSHLAVFWKAREQPNVHLFHYADYEADLVGQLGRLAEVLGIERTPARLAELAPAATFEAMKGRAAEVAPNATRPIWKDTTAFFHHGRSGRWRDIGLGDADVARYHERVAELVPKDLGDWAHQGWLGAGRA